jgi:hypothetical protein
MTEEKSDQLGLRGLLDVFQSTLRLVGAANATGVISAGVVFHTYDKGGPLSGVMGVVGLIFLFGVLAFVFAYVGLFICILELVM